MTGTDPRASIRIAAGELGLGSGVTAIAPLTGGCIHRVYRVDLDGGRRLVAKINDAACEPLFREEAAGLEALAETDTVRVPRTHGVAVVPGAALLLLEWLEPGPATEASWSRFGAELAALHRAPGDARYGFPFDNHLGATLQENGWSEDWVAFNRERRFGPQVRLAVDAGLLSRAERAAMDAVIDRLERLLPARPFAALLHGDLWSGNALATAGRIAVIDPAPSRGDGWADIAMMRLFGGFPERCFDAYAATIGEHEPADRVAVYQLYHVLNHVNLFGRSYVAQSMALARRLA